MSGSVGMDHAMVVGEAGGEGNAGVLGCRGQSRCCDLGLVCRAARLAPVGDAGRALLDESGNQFLGHPAIRGQHAADEDEEGCHLHIPGPGLSNFGGCLVASAVVTGAVRFDEDAV